MAARSDKDTEHENGRRRHGVLARILLFVWLLGILTFILTIHYLSPMTSLITRVPGAGNHLINDTIAMTCNRSDPSMYGYHQCSNFIDCVIGHISDIGVNDLGQGATLAGVLPTIFIFIAMEPLDMFKKGLIAPHRALAIACFPIGLPVALFARLRPVRHGIHSVWGDSHRARTSMDVEAVIVEGEDTQAKKDGGGIEKASKQGKTADGKAADDEAARTLSWDIHFAVLSTTNRWTHLGVKAFSDVLIMALSGSMVYRNWVVNLLVMVPWKCETPIMTFAWTLASMFWMVTILLLFFSLHHDLRFEDADNHDITYKWWEAVLLPYTLNFKPNGSSKGDSWKSSWEKRNTEWRDGQKTPNYRIRIVLVMPSESGIRSWSFYEFTITMLSAAVYFYGTFVWLSVVFLGAVPALHYVGLTIGVYVAIRIIDGLSGDIYSSVSPDCTEEPTSTVVDVSKAT